MPMRPFLSRSNAKRENSDSPDSELIAACLAGSETAWDALLERYQSLIYSLVVRMGLSGTDAEDVFQDVCLLLLNHLGDLRDESKLSSWLISTTKREVWRRHRRRGALPMSDIPDWQLEGAEPVGTEALATLEEAVLALEDQHLVRQALTQIGTPCRLLLTLLYCEDSPSSYAEVAQKLAMPLGSIGPQRARCLRQMEKILDRLGF